MSEISTAGMTVSVKQQNMSVKNGSFLVADVYHLSLPA